MVNEIEGKNDVAAYTPSVPVPSDRDSVKYEYNLYLFGKVCIVVLRALLVGAKACFIPTVKAARAEPEPQYPKPMRYMDLPIYECPAHVHYKDHLYKKMICPEKKLIHDMVHPHVVTARKEVAKNLEAVKTEVVNTVNSVKKEAGIAQKKFLSQCRSPENEMQRQIAMVVGGVIGFMRGKGTLTKRVIMTALGTSAVGSLCYPKETDEAVREFFFHANKGLYVAASFFCGKTIEPRGRLPCRKDLPDIPPPIEWRKINCPKK